MNWASMSLREFQAALASSSPTPGGGTASAVALGQAAALSIMVCDLTLGKEKWAEGWGIAEEIQSLAIPLMERANELATEDSDAFDGVMAGFALPKSTDEKKMLGVRKFELRPMLPLKFRLKPLLLHWIYSRNYHHSPAPGMPTLSRTLVWLACWPVLLPKVRCSTLTSIWRVCQMRWLQT